MAEPDDSAGPAAFAASFPPEQRFVATAAELAARLASTCGCSAEAAEEVRGAVSRAFSQALASAVAGGPGIDVTLRTGAGGFEADVTCGGQILLHCAKARSV
jgi:hypothetical protein